MRLLGPWQKECVIGWRPIGGWLSAASLAPVAVAPRSPLAWFMWLWQGLMAVKRQHFVSVNAAGAGRYSNSH